MSRPKPKFYAEYRCPVCDYTTVVTNVCRRCVRNMYPTGFEEKLNRDFTVERRKVTKDSCQYEQVIQWHHFAKLNSTEHGEEVPDWAVDLAKEMEAEK